MPAKKKPKPSLEACQKLWALIATAKDLSPEIEKELLGLVYASWPGRRKSWLQELAFPEIHRLVNGVAIWQEPPGKRFSVYAASKMIAKTTKHGSWKALAVGYYRWLRKRTPQELRVICKGEKKRPHKPHKPGELVRKVSGYVI
jgi:hypothetical protein